MNRLQEAISEQSRPPLVGVSLSRYDPVFVEICGQVGFDIVWFDMEHGFITFAEAENLCRIGSGLGMLTLIRIPDAQRQNVLKAAECGPDIINLPMANSPEIVEELVRHARYTPEGDRGFIGGSRAMNYGRGEPIAEQRARVNQGLCLMAQIETQQAVERVEAICRVPGLDIIFLGLGDLSASMGVVGQTNHPTVMAAADQVIATARSQGKLVAVPGRPADVALWANKGVDVVFCTGDITSLRSGLESAYEEARATEA